MDLPNWVDPDAHGWVIHPESADDWSALLAAYGGQGPEPLRRIFEAVQERACRTVVIENRYVDLDFRSEYAAFWASRFDGTPAFARRLHFFGGRFDEEALHELPDDCDYFGYAVIRPIPLGAVGRSVIAPPPRVEAAVMAHCKDGVTLFGNELSVLGAPFVQQDTQYLRCAHAAIWMCHYTAARRGLVARLRTSAFVEAAPAMLSMERALPSKGLTLNQIQAVLGASGQPAIFYGLGQLPTVLGVEEPAPAVDPAGNPLPPGKWDTRIFSVACRYLNSGYPVLVVTEDHGFVLVGWFREGDRIRFVANDDQRGPYQVIESPFEDERGTWQGVMVPLPPRVLLSGEAAENAAHFRLRAFGQPPAPDEWQAIADGVATKSISLRTVLRDSNQYKVALRDRRLPDEVVRLLRLARLPHYVWVVEAHDRDRRLAGEPCVLAEVIFDCTSSDLSPRCDAILLPGVAVTYPPDGGALESASMPNACWQSAIAGHAA